MTNGQKAKTAREKNLKTKMANSQQDNHKELHEQSKKLATALVCQGCFQTFAAQAKEAELKQHIENKHPKKGTFEENFPDYQQIQDMVKDINIKNKPKNKPN